MIKCQRILILTAIACGTIAHNAICLEQNNNPTQDANYAKIELPEKIQGCSKPIEGLVTREGMAKEIAYVLHLSKMVDQDDVLIKDSPEQAHLIRVNFNLPNFAEKGDLVWQVRVMNLGQLRSIIWIHTKTADAFAVAGPWDTQYTTVKKAKIVGLYTDNYGTESERAWISKKNHGLVGCLSFTNVSDKIILIDGSTVEKKERNTLLSGEKIYSKSYASFIAENAGCSMPNNGSYGGQLKSDTKYIFSLGYDIPGFANSGDQLWEVWIEQKHTNLKEKLASPLAIFWVHPCTGEVYCAWGPWFVDGDGANISYRKLEQIETEPVVTIQGVPTRTMQIKLPSQNNFDWDRTPHR